MPRWNASCTTKGMTGSTSRQTCKVCQREDYFDFHVPDEIWGVIVPEPFRHFAVCLSCFDRFAAKRNVDYAPWLDLLYFSGDQSSFQFKVVWGKNSVIKN